MYIHAAISHKTRPLLDNAKCLECGVKSNQLRSDYRTLITTTYTKAKGVKLKTRYLTSHDNVMLTSSLNSKIYLNVLTCKHCDISNVWTADIQKMYKPGELSYKYNAVLVTTRNLVYTWNGGNVLFAGYT